MGNLANDGVKLAAGNGKCSAEPQDGLEVEAKGGTLRYVMYFDGVFRMKKKTLFVRDLMFNYNYLVV